jgi:hypothetical protein
VPLQYTVHAPAASVIGPLATSPVAAPAKIAKMGCKHNIVVKKEDRQ